MSVRRSVAIGLVVVFVVLPIVGAVPMVVDVSTATVFVDGASDTFEFAPCSAALAGGTEWTLRGPFGQELTLTRTMAASTAPHAAQRWRLDGTQLSGQGGLWTASGDLDGAPADGTWVVSLNPGSALCVSSTTETGTRMFDAELSIQGRFLHWDVQNSFFADGFVQNWNWHIGSWTEPEHVGVTPNTAMDPVNEDPAEDPDDARFFEDLDEPQDPNPTPITNQGTVTCPNTLTMEGLWARGGTQSGNTFVRFVHVEGQHGNDPDLRDNVGAEFTTLVDDGAGQTGSHTDSTAYNNAAGHSFQFLARAGSGGVEQLGDVLTVAAEQCELDPMTGSLASSRSAGFDLSVSHAVCEGQLASFTVDVDLSPAITLNDLDVLIIDTTDNSLLEQVDDSEMFSQNMGQVRLFALALPAGPFAAWAFADLAGVGAVDVYDSQAVTVLERERCDIGDVTTTIITGLNQTRINLTEITHNEVENVSLVKFAGYDGPETGSLILFLVLMVFCLYHGYIFTAFAALLGLVSSIIGPLVTTGSETWFWFSIVGLVLVVLGFWAESIVRGWRLRKQADSTASVD